MIENIEAKIFMYINNQYYELKPSKLTIAETPKGTEVEIIGTVKDDWVAYRKDK